MVPHELVTVTPDVASFWLTRSKQADVKEEKIETYRAAMQGGRWDPEKHRNDPVKFWDGRLINGNHRLHAIVACGLSVTLWVLGEPPEADDED